MGMTCRQHRNLSLFAITAVKALDSQDALFGRSCFLSHFAAAENMYINIYSFIAVISADEPVFLGIESDFRRVCFTVTARSTVMLRPFSALGTDAVAASVSACSLRTAAFTQTAIGAGISAILTCTALTAYCGTVGTDSFTTYADVSPAISAESALFTHRIGTIRTFSAVGAEYVGAVRAFSAVIAPHIGAVFTDISAFAADGHAVSALSAPFTEGILSRTFDTHITGQAEGITACRAFFAALGADVGTVGAAFAAGTRCDAFAAFLAVCAPAVRT